MHEKMVAKQKLMVLQPRLRPGAEQRCSQLSSPSAGSALRCGTEQPGGGKCPAQPPAQCRAWVKNCSLGASLSSAATPQLGTSV